VFIHRAPAGGIWSELERSHRKVEKMRSLLFASHEHLLRYQQAEAGQQAKVNIYIYYMCVYICIYVSTLRYLNRTCIYID